MALITDQGKRICFLQRIFYVILEKELQSTSALMDTKVIKINGGDCPFKQTQDF